jgi:small subunit ribosomal protein S1
LRRKQKKLGPVPSLRQHQSFVPGESRNAAETEMERELEEAMGGLSEQQIYAEPAQVQQVPGQAAPPRKRQRGKVISLHGGDVFLELPGSRSGGVISLSQFPEGRPEIGSEVDVEIEGYDAANGILLLTRKGAATEADWGNLAPGLVVEARVLETNKGGLTVSVNGIRGFMPISQIDLFRVEKADDYVNQKLRCIVTQADQASRNLVVSRKVLLEQEREEQRRKMWEELSEGQVREGVVRSVQPYGAFVDLGGVDGLLHVSEMSWQRVKNPTDIVQPGQRVRVVILKLDRDSRKVGLGLKQLTASPWDDVDQKYHPGTVASGKVSKLADFGAFVELEPGIEGLIPISEMAAHRVYRVSDIVKPDQVVQVQVLNVDKERRRISLSLKALQKMQEAAAAQQPTEEPEPEPEKPRPPRVPRKDLRGGIGDKPLEED